MISKQLVHDIVAFHNTWIKNKHIIAAIEIFCSDFIGVKFSYWTRTPDGYLKDHVIFIVKNIYNREDFNNYTVEVSRKLAECSLENDDD